MVDPVIKALSRDAAEYRRKVDVAAGERISVTPEQLKARLDQAFNEGYRVRRI